MHISTELCMNTDLNTIHDHPSLETSRMSTKLNTNKILFRNDEKEKPSPRRGDVVVQISYMDQL